MRNLMLLAMLLAAPVAAQVPAPAPVAPVEAYLLGPLDQIEVNVANFPDLTTKARIGANGGVVLPLIGEVPLGGRTQADAAAEIGRRYKAGGYVNAPAVRVEILEYQSRRASVLGQVTNQGLIVLDRDYGVAELLARVGGLSSDAAEEASIVRTRPDGSTETIVVNLAQIGGQGALTKVRPGDVVFVARAPTISVVGAVNRAGVYRLTGGMTVQQALATAGDVARIGSRRGLVIRRTPAGGGATTQLPATLDTPLQPGDVVVVKERVF